MSSRRAPRLNRLPQRLDYTLIPAPLDLSLPLVDEKADLPAIIVTPSSPSSVTDFCIAFLAPPPKPPLYKRLVASLPPLPSLSSYLPSQIRLPPSPFKNSFDEENFDINASSSSITSRARIVVLLSILLFVMVSHVVLHRFAISHPRLDFDLIHNDAQLKSWVASAKVESSRVVSEPASIGRYNHHALWAPTAGNSRSSSDILDAVPVEPVAVETPTEETAKTTNEHDKTEP